MPRRPLHGFVVVAALAAAVLAVFAATATSKTLAVPTTTSPPTVEGSPIVGQTLGAGNGEWSNSPTSYTYQWQRCDANGSGCADIGGATDKSYQVVSADGGHTLRVLVTASNSDGNSQPANSHPTAVVSTSGQAQSTARPSISGTAQVGDTLTADKGTWNSATSSWAYQWQRCDSNGNNCADIQGAHGRTYGVRNDDVGHTIRVVVTGTGSAGKSSATSDRTNAVTAAQAPAPANTNPCSKLAANAQNSAVAVADLSLPNRLIISGVTFSPSKLTSRSTFTARFRVMDTCGRPVQGALVYAAAVPFGRIQNAPEVATDAQGWATIQMTPTQRLSLTPGTAVQMFVRARKPGDNLLAGVSTRRLVHSSSRWCR
jgi:hypothetical protein